MAIKMIKDTEMVTHEVLLSCYCKWLSNIWRSF